MKKYVLILLTAFGSMIFSAAYSQDIRFTQFHFTPLTVNPASTGYFYGTARISGIYRQEGLGATTLQGNALYTTPVINIDVPIVLGFSEKHWIGGGLAMYSDDAGSLSLQLAGFQGSIGYHMGLGGSKTKGRRGGRRSGVRGAISRLKDKKRVFVPSKTYLSIGLTYGNRSRQFDMQNVVANEIFGDEFSMQGQSMDRSGLMGEGESVIETGVGLMLTSQVNERADFQIGASAFHIIQDNFSLLSPTGGGGGGMNPPASNRNSRDDMKLTFHARYNQILNEKWSIHPQVIYRTQGEATDGALQTMAGYRFDEEKDITLLGGLGYRLTDAVQIMVGAKVGDLRAGIAFDYDVSDITQSTAFMNGFEIGASYIIKIYKKPQADPVIFCPRL